MTKNNNERELVLQILLAVNVEQRYSHIALREVLSKYQYLEKKERAFITRVVEGTLERMIEIDYVLNQFSKTKVKKMKPVIREVLRSAVYQLLYMDNVPDSAACNEAVKLAVKRGFSGLRGFVNGLLRNIARNKDAITYPSERDELAYLSVTYSMPEWILKQWLPVYGRETVTGMLKYFLSEQPTTIRCNTNRITPEELLEMLENEGVQATQHPQLPYALTISGYDYLGGLKSFQDGYFQVQDLSSMYVAEAAEPKPGAQVIDVCAAPGGKAIHIAEKLNGTGLVKAYDLTETKAAMIRENIARSGLTNIEAGQQDATQYQAALSETADIVIADLPCSGLGVLGKKTDLKYRMSEAQQAELVILQRRILEVARQYVKPGGRLIYSTCTVHRSENEDNAAWFAKQFPEFTMLSQEQRLPGQGGGDGFYIACFDKGVV